MSAYLLLFYLTKRNKFFKQSKIASLCISIETVEVTFFVTGLETLQILGVEVTTGGSTESNVRSFEAFLTICLLIITRNIQ
jgi:hypothetical protein